MKYKKTGETILQKKKKKKKKKKKGNHITRKREIFTKGIFCPKVYGPKKMRRFKSLTWISNPFVFQRGPCQTHDSAGIALLLKMI
jgi:hypothetical protein